MRLIRLNVERIATREADIIRLKAEGFKELDGVSSSPSTLQNSEAVDLSSLNVEQLKEVAKEKDIEGFSTMKKPELITALKDVM